MVFASAPLAQQQGAPALPAASSSFYVAMRVLPAAQRQAMFDIYAFCRAVDDIADGDAPAPERRAQLEQWRHDIDACYAGDPPGHLFSLHRHIAAFGLARADFQAVIDGMLMDADASICAPEAALLDAYCDRVASAVGRLSVRVFGMPHDDGILLAHHLGRALQLTNILRDIDEDAGIGRVYLPREALLAAGVELGTATAIAAHPALPGACTQLVEQAQAHFHAADTVLRYSPGHAARAPRIMGAAYHAVLRRLVARGWASPRRPVKVPRLQRIGILLRYALA
ncbi:MAG: presqualene diphosphate synthase HpnD [Massilia sp.]